MVLPSQAWSVLVVTYGIRLERVSKMFGGVKAVDDVNLDVADGEFVSVLGPSGCGKTTLLRMLAGLEQPTSGRISIGGAVVNELPPSRRNIAMVFQTYALYPHMTVAANIEYPLKKRGLAKAERRERVRQAAAVLQLEALMSRKPRELSGGQQQRVALGRALVRDPAVFLLDEPLSNLDAKLRSHMRAELMQLHRRVRRTMVYVTHDQLEAMTMSDRIAVLNCGRLQQFGTPDDVYRRPANEFVAGFIGSPAMNFMSGRISTRIDGSTFRSGDGDPELHGLRLKSMGESDAAEMPVKVGFRPEDIVFDEGAEARVVLVEPTGHELIVVFDYLGNEVIARMSPDRSVKVDDRIRLSPRIDKLHVFSAKDGRRLNDDDADNDSGGGKAED